MVSDIDKADAAQTSGRRGKSVSITADRQPKASVIGRPLGCLTLAAAMRCAVCGAYVVLVTWLSLVPGKFFIPAMALFPHADKLVHFLMYGFLVVLVRWAMAGYGLRWRPRGFWVPLAALVYGGLMELAQLLVVTADRSFEGWDVVANGVGALVFWCACNLWSVWCLRPAARATNVGVKPVSEADAKFKGVIPDGE